MVTLTVAHQKGGVGKTTLAYNLAHAFADSAKVAIVDTDLQGSINSIASYVKGIDLIPADQAFKGLKGYDMLVIDSPPYLTETMMASFAISDLVLIPTKAGLLDAIAMGDTIKLLRKAMQKRPALKAGIVLNMIQTTRNSIMQEVRQELLAYDIPILPTLIHQRNSYIRSLFYNGVMQGSDEKAKDEIHNLSLDVYNLLS